MAKHASNADRIARAAAEAEATTKEKAEKKKTRKTAASPRKSRVPKAAARMKVVWAVGVPGLVPLKTFAYPERAAADAEAVKRGKGCMVTPLKVPMEA